MFSGYFSCRKIAISAIDGVVSVVNHLAQKQGTGGLPKAPDTGTTASDVPPPPPDTDAAHDLTDQEAAADQAETQVEQESAGGPGAER